MILALLQPFPVNLSAYASFDVPLAGPHLLPVLLIVTYTHFSYLTSYSVDRLRLAARLLRQAFDLLRANDPLRLGAATAFFTLFALPPILIILTTLFGAIFRGAIEKGLIFAHLSQLVGSSSAEEIQVILLNITGLSRNSYFTFAGSVFLLFVSTTLFIVIQNSLHQLWSIRHRSGFGVKQLLKDRAISLALILLSGLLFIFGLLSEFAIAWLQHSLRRYEHELNVMALQVINYLVSMVLFAVWFMLLFRYLPHTRLGWRVVATGGILTSLLFSFGTYLLGIFLVNSNLGTVYGAAGSIVVLLLFVFYSSLILYFGAAFVWVYANNGKYTIELKPYATRFQILDEEFWEK